MTSRGSRARAAWAAAFACVAAGVTAGLGLGLGVGVVQAQQAQDGVAGATVTGVSGAPSPALPLPDWQEVPAISLFPPVDRSASAAGTGPGGVGFEPGWDPSTAPGVGVGWDDPLVDGGAPVPPPVDGFTDPAELQRYIDSLPELEEVAEFVPGQDSGKRVGDPGEEGDVRLDWMPNPRKAKRLAQEQGKYFLLAFVGLQWQTLSNALNSEVFNTRPFAEFGSETLVASYLDFSQNPEDNHPVYERFKDVCGVKGFPAVALFAPDGFHLETYNGYNQKAGPEAYFLRLKDRITADQYRLENVAKRREMLEASGYRTWRNSHGKAVFARLRGLRGGRVYFEHEDGRRTAAPISALAFVDQEIARRTAPGRAGGE